MQSFDTVVDFNVAEHARCRRLIAIEFDQCFSGNLEPETIVGDNPEVIVTAFEENLAAQANRRIRCPPHTRAGIRKICSTSALFRHR